jgi:hypothetical protein
MHSGAITGNTSSTNYGGGVMVYDGATFTMHGGEISGNTSASAGGGLMVNGTLTMHGGTISGNNAPYGGGMYVSSGTFDMHGGTISGNTATNSSGYGGGGVFVAGGTFNMHDGTISGNTAVTGSEGGGGVHVYGTSSSIFHFVTGTIYGSNATPNTLRNNAPAGAALYKSNNSNTTQRGTFDANGEWIPGGNLTTTNNTIQ